MKFLDLFAGVGGFRRGMELAGHTCVGFCEWDKYAAMSYTSMHLMNEEQRSRLSDMSLNQRQKEIQKEEYRNGEWYSTDVRLITSDNVPDADCWCFGAPCQDFSIAGKRAGLDGDRSSLVREVFRILKEIPEENRPEWLIYENVKGMLSSNRGGDFGAILLEMGELGYDTEWQLFNTKNFGVPQNRERVYTIGHLRNRGRKQVFPLKGADGEDSIRINPEVIGGIGEKTYGTQYHQQNRIYDGHKVATALTSNMSGNVNYYAFGIDDSVFGVKQIGQRNRPGRSNLNQYRVYDTEGLSPCLNKMDGGGLEPHIAIPVLTPDRAEKRQNGRRFKDNGEPSFTLTSQDRHGIVKLNDNTTVYAVWYEKYQCYIAIRKLTPRECFRLQGWTDDYFERAAFVNSDSQLYKQAGNGVTVDVVAEIARQLSLFEEDNDEEP